MNLKKVKQFENNVLIDIFDYSFIIETTFRKKEEESLFIMNGIEVNKDELALEWTHEQFGKIKQTIRFEDGSNEVFGRYKLEIIPNNNTDGVIVQSIGRPSETKPYYMIPGVLYGTNNILNSKSKQVQLNYRGDIHYPKTPVFYTRADRSTHNAVIAMEDELVYSLRIDECSLTDQLWFYNGLGIDTRHFDKYDRISMTIGYHHFPVHYYGKLGPEHSHTLEDELEMIPFKGGESLITKGHLYFALNSKKDLYGYEKTQKFYYNEIHKHPNNKALRTDSIKDLATALLEDAYNWKYHYFPTVLSGEQADTGVDGDMAWTGGMQVVYPLIKAMSTVPEAKKLVDDFVGQLVTEGFREEVNFFYESKSKEKWLVSGWWRQDLNVYNRSFQKLDVAHSAYINGQVATYLLKGYQEVQKQKYEFEHLELWTTRVKTMLEHVIKQQRYDGAYGVYYDSDSGEAVYFNSFQGAWFLAAVAEAYKVFGDAYYKESIDKALPFYGEFLANLEQWGTPIDTQDAVDEEGNLAYITALKTIHEVTQDDAILETLLHALHLEFSWKFAYNTSHVNEPLKSLNWSSSGGSITSTHNIHLHQMGNLIADEIYYVYKMTHDDYIKERLKDTLNWGLGTYNTFDKEFGYGKKGWATEQFYHSDGKQDDYRRVVDGGIWPDYLSWAAACVLLSSSADIEEEYYK